MINLRKKTKNAFGYTPCMNDSENIDKKVKKNQRFPFFMSFSVCFFLLLSLNIPFLSVLC